MFFRSWRVVAPVGCAAALLAATPASAAVRRGPDLAVVREDPAPVHPGGATMLHARALNSGRAALGRSFTMVVRLPRGVSVAAPVPGGCRVRSSGHEAACTFPAGLRPGAEDVAELRLAVPAWVPPGVRTGEIRATFPGDPTPGDDAARFRIVIR